MLWKHQCYCFVSPALWPLCDKSSHSAKPVVFPVTRNLHTPWSRYTKWQRRVRNHQGHIFAPVLEYESHFQLPHHPVQTVLDARALLIIFTTARFWVSACSEIVKHEGSQVASQRNPAAHSVGWFFSLMFFFRLSHLWLLLWQLCSMWTKSLDVCRSLFFLFMCWDDGTIW